MDAYRPPVTPSNLLSVEGGTVNRTDLQELAEIRIAEAVALLGLTPPKSDGAYYLGGYAVELALKACIAKTVNLHDWPERKFVADCHTHDNSALIRLAALEKIMDADILANPLLEANWIIVTDWNERCRYLRHSQDKAQKLIDAITDVTNGVLPWIKTHW
jgi:hypothetical protein